MAAKQKQARQTNGARAHFQYRFVRMTSAKGLKIVVPIHEEKGWLCSSPDEVQERLQRTPVKTLEEISAKDEKRRENATRLHNAHLEFVKMKATRDIERSKAAIARRLRLEENERNMIARRLDFCDDRRDHRQHELMRRLKEKKMLREARANDVRDAREAAKKAREASLARSLLVEERASIQRGKRVQQTRDRCAWQVKHAIAVATAFKEKHHQRAETLKANVALRLEKAASLREDAKMGISIASSQEMAKARAVRLRRHNLQHCELEEKKARHALKLAKAEAARLERLDAIVSRCRKVGSLDETRLEPERKVAAATARKEIFAKLQAAEVRRLQHGLNTLQTPRKVEVVEKAEGGDKTSDKKLMTRKTALVPAVIWIPAPNHRPKRLLPPVHLLERLLSKPRFLVATASARQKNAAARRATIAALHAAKAAHRSSIFLARTAGRLAIQIEFNRTTLESRARAAVMRASSFIQSRRDKAATFNLRIDAARRKRAAAYMLLVDRAIARERNALVTITNTRLLTLSRPLVCYGKVLRAAAAARRQSAHVRCVAAAEKSAEKRAAANSRRDSLLSARVARAALSQVPFSMAAKLQEARSTTSMALWPSPLSKTWAAGKRGMANLAVEVTESGATKLTIHVTGVKSGVDAATQFPDTVGAAETSQRDDSEQFEDGFLLVKSPQK